MIAPLDDLPDWSFEIDEVSMGIYQIRGKHTLGWTIEITGTSERDLISNARKAAQEVALRNGIPELATYIAALSDAARNTRRAEDRSRYRDHLATAALVFERLQHGALASAKQLVADERRSFGLDFLDGEAGASAEAAFARFAGSSNTSNREVR